MLKTFLGQCWVGSRTHQLEITAQKPWDVVMGMVSFMGTCFNTSLSEISTAIAIDWGRIKYFLFVLPTAVGKC